MRQKKYKFKDSRTDQEIQALHLNDNDIQGQIDDISTTGLSDDAAEPLGTAAAGTGTEASRDDHVHLLPTAIATNSAHVSGDGSDHADVATNSTHVAGDGSDHADVATNTSGIATNVTAIGLNTTHRGTDGTADHSYVSVNRLERNHDRNVQIYTTGAITVTGGGSETLIENQDTYNVDKSFRQDANAAFVAQGFKHASETTISKIGVYGYGITDVTSGTIWAQIHTDDSDKPYNDGNLTDVGSYITNGKSVVEDAQDWVEGAANRDWYYYTFTTPPTIAADTKYWLVICGDWVIGTDGKLGMSFQSSGGPYRDSNYNFIYAGTDETWDGYTANDYDQAFRIYSPASGPNLDWDDTIYIKFGGKMDGSTAAYYNQIATGDEDIPDGYAMYVTLDRDANPDGTTLTTSVAEYNDATVFNGANADDILVIAWNEGGEIYHRITEPTAP